MSFFIKEENVRPGNRGGRDQFKWDNIRLLNNKDRESYLGVTQSIGFLDKGGKWRKRDWWLKNEDFAAGVDKNAVRQERDSIKKEEERLMMEALYPGLKDKKANKVDASSGNAQKAKLTDYEWKELMKKEGNLAPDDAKLFEFYANDDRRAGIGMKPVVSFRTNPYSDNNLARLEGLNIEEKKEENIEDNDNPYVMKDKEDGNIQNKTSPQNRVVDKYIKQFLKDKNYHASNIGEVEKIHKEKERKDSREKKKEKKKDKKEKKDKKHKKNRSRSRSYSRHNHKKSKHDK